MVGGRSHPSMNNRLLETCQAEGMSDRRTGRARSGRHGVTADSGMEYVNE